MEHCDDSGGLSLEMLLSLLNWASLQQCEEVLIPSQSKQEGQEFCPVGLRVLQGLVLHRPIL